MTVLIAGGGVGGLTLALMLHARGIKSVVFEQANEIREVGVGINTLPHAIKELAALGLLPALDAAAIRTKELIYINRLGQEVWRETRGIDAGFEYPQFSIHRGRLQKLILDAVYAHLGPGAVRTGLRLAGFMQDEGGVTAHFTDARYGTSSETVRGEVLVAADGIHSIARKYFYPKEGPPSWQGVLLWRGAVPLGLLARVRDLLPGRYTFGLTGRDANGGVLAPGDYRLRLVAWPTGRGSATVRTIGFTVQ